MFLRVLLAAALLACASPALEASTCYSQLPNLEGPAYRVGASFPFPFEVTLADDFIASSSATVSQISLWGTGLAPGEVWLGIYRDDQGRPGSVAWATYQWASHIEPAKTGDVVIKGPADTPDSVAPSIAKYVFDLAPGREFTPVAGNRYWLAVSTWDWDLNGDGFVGLTDLVLWTNGPGLIGGHGWQGSTDGPGNALFSTYDAWQTADPQGVFDNNENHTFAPGLESGWAQARYDGSGISLAFELVPEPATLRGDFNNDGVVNDGDYTVWADFFNKTPVTGYQHGQGENSGYNDADYTTWADNFGKTAGDVPEPFTLSLLAWGGIAMLKRRRGLGR